MKQEQSASELVAASRLWKASSRPMPMFKFLSFFTLNKMCDGGDGKEKVRTYE